MDIKSGYIERCLTVDFKEGFRQPGEIPALILCNGLLPGHGKPESFEAVRDVLIRRGFQVTVFSETDLSNEKFVKCFGELSQKTVLVVVFLDSTNPYLMYRYAFFKGRKKNVLPLLEKKERERAGDGLVLLSDLDAIRPLVVDLSASVDGPGYPELTVQKALHAQMPEVIRLYCVQNLKIPESPASDAGTGWRPLVVKSLEYLTQLKSFQGGDLGRLIKEIDDLERLSGGPAPVCLYQILGSLYEILESDSLHEGMQDAPYGSNALKFYNKVLSLEPPPEVCRSVHQKIARLSLELSWAFDRQENCDRAMQSCNQALQGLREDFHPWERALIHANRGFVYLSAAEGGDGVENCERGIQSFQEALRVLTPRDFPFEHEKIQEALEILQARLELFRRGPEPLSPVAADESKSSHDEEAPPVETHQPSASAPRIASLEPQEIPDSSDLAGDPEGKRIRAYQQALKIFTRAEFPLEHALYCGKMAEEYERLDRETHSLEYLERALEAYQEAARIYESEKLTEEYARMIRCSGEVHRRLGEEGRRPENLKRAVEAFQQALGVCEAARDPAEYVVLQNEIGILYSMLLETEGGPDYFERADKAFQQALKLCPREECFRDFLKSVTENHAHLLDFWKHMYR